MAAAAADSLDAVVELLLAGADPDLPSPTGVIAADLAGDRGIMKILALVSTEVEAEAKRAALASPDADAEEIRRRALGTVKGRGLDLLRRVLKPGSLLKFLQPEPSPEPQPAAEEEAATGLSAREARKQRAEAAERERLRKVAERAAARRSEDQEELERQRLQRVAEKVAARRDLDPEEARLAKIAQGAALRRQVSLRPQRGAEELSACTALALLPEDQGRPSVERKKTSEYAQCHHCGQSGQRKECGACGEMGMCGFCSMCSKCGRVSGFCERPEVHARPGMYGLSGMPNLSGLSAEELKAFEPPAGSPTADGKSKKKKKKRKRKGGSSTGDSSSGLEFVGAPKGSPKEGDSDAEETYGIYFVDNREYKAPSQGMAFRYSKNLTDTVKDMRKFAAWGTTLTGWDQGDGWLKVGEFFLPFLLEGKRVLTFKGSAEEAMRPGLKKQKPALEAPRSPAGVEL